MEEIQATRASLTARDDLRRRQEVASTKLTDAVVALQMASRPTEINIYAARELMARAWELLGDAGYIDACTAAVRSLAKLAPAVDATGGEA